jgi:RimJ/RimL family protein N-acetyltransferase
MTNEISLRRVEESDLPIFFEQQLEPEGIRMAAFPSRNRDAFMTHWHKIMAEETNILMAILFQGEVAGNIVSWEQAGKRKVGYWLGKSYWGKGIASAGLFHFLREVKVRPLFAHVAKQNVASIRVLQKCGFTIAGEDKDHSVDGEAIEEFIMILAENA